MTAGGALRDGARRRARLDRSRLYLCTDLRRERGDLQPFLDAVLAAGVDVVQLRDKHASLRELRAAAETCRAAADRHGALFVVNDDPQLAAAVDADGVHVGQDDPPPAVARQAVGPDRLVGRSTHSRGEVMRALREDCDYFAVGPVHATPTKEGRPAIGLGPVRLAARVAGRRPWFVTGGMAVDTIREVGAAGARRFVVVRAIAQAHDPGAAVRALTGMVDRPFA
ncbi:MAG TPA: thiamine phosphate synthase [Nitriliruptorales bacterium]|nr:thiamine phosphate synthase [Nitriliruptorales bacterium]